MYNLVIFAATTCGLAANTGTVHFKPIGDQSDIPERYRFSERTFDYTMKPLRELPVSGVEISQITFPSPVTSPTPENNTVYAEYYRPTGAGPFPAVIVLDITGGDQSLSRFIARTLAQNRSPASSCRWRIMVRAGRRAASCGCFRPISRGQWRRSARRFSIAVMRPPGSRPDRTWTIDESVSWAQAWGASSRL